LSDTRGKTGLEFESPHIHNSYLKMGMHGIDRLYGISWVHIA